MSFFCIVFNEKNQETSTNILGVSVLGGTRWNPSEPVQICPDPFEHVETCYNLSKHVSIRSDLLEHVRTCRNTLQSVQTCWNTFRPVETRFHASPLLPPSPSPFSPFFFFLGGGEGGGGRGGNTITGPPLRILTTTKKNYQNYQNIQIFKICVIYPRGFSQSTAQNYKTYEKCWPLHKIHCGILINII